MDISEFPTPALIIYLDKVKKNAASMIQRCKEYGVKLRPHFKTTKAVEIAEILSGGSKRGFVVSTLPEAELLAESGFDDILYGIPFGNDPVKGKRCAALNEKLSEFHVMVDDLQKVDILVNLAKNSSKKWSAFISIDCGHHREGILHNLNEVVEMAKRLVEENANINFQGLYAHSGHSYHSKDQKGIHEIADEAVTNLLAVVERLRAIGIECKTYGVGSTPTCCQPSELMRKVTEWHPGNYALYDVWQMMLGSCKEDDIACAVATRVLGHYSGEGRNHLLVDCGFTALTQQGAGKVPSGGIGAVASHPELKLETTQELGKVTTVDGSPVKFEMFPLGSMLYILPYHSCATCCVHRLYYVADSKGKIIDQWTPASGW